MAALSALIPSELETDLLLSCVAEPGRAAEAWSRFLTAVPRPDELFRADTGRRKRLAPLLLQGLKRAGVELPPYLATVLRTATMREGLRAQAYYRIAGELTEALAKAGIPHMMMGGGALGLSEYDDPALRHSHELDLLVGPRGRALAVEALEQRGLRRRPEDRHRLWTTLRHRTGMPVRLKTRLFGLPVYRTDWGEVWARARTIQLRGRDVVIPGRVDALLRTATDAAYRPGSTSLHWATDLVRLSAGLDAAQWADVAASGRRSGTALPTTILLAYARDVLGASVPDGGDLRLLETIDPVARDAALYAARKGPGGGAKALLSRVDVRDRVRVARWLALPDPEFLRAMEPEGPPDAGLAWYARHVARRATRWVRPGRSREPRAALQRS
jgi:hypothetical protein